MINDIYASLTSITEGIHKDTRNEGDYKELNNKFQKSIAYKTPPLFTISFAEKDFGAKRKYYKKLIDNETCNKFNELIDSFPENAIEHEHIFNYQKIFDQYKHHLRNVDNYIKKYNFHRDNIQEENTFVIQYLKTNMIWLYLELQERFAEYGEEDRFTVEEIYKYYFNEIIKEIEIIPNTKTEAIISPKKEVPIFIPISNDLTHRPIKTNIMSYDIIVKESKSLSRAEQMMFEAGIIDKDYNFINYKTLLLIFNSTLFEYFVKNNSNTIRGGYLRYRPQYIKEFRIPDLKLIDQINFIEVADRILKYTQDLHYNRNKFQNYLKQKFQLQKLSKKLQNWHELAFGDFIKELNKAIKLSNKQRLKDNLQEVPTLTKKDEFEWLDLFEENKQKAQELQTQINQTDKEIDQMVYELYNLTKEEIEIVENS